MMLEELLKHIQRTNPNMTMARLLKELCISEYSTKALVMSANNTK